MDQAHLGRVSGTFNYLLGELRGTAQPIPRHRDGFCEVAILRRLG